MTEERPWTPPPEIIVTLEPAGRSFSMPRPKTALQLLRKLEIRPGTALVIRTGGRAGESVDVCANGQAAPHTDGRETGLLTPDRHIFPGDAITVRIVTSSG